MLANSLTSREDIDTMVSPQWPHVNQFRVIRTRGTVETKMRCNYVFQGTRLISTWFLIKKCKQGNCFSREISEASYVFFDQLLILKPCCSTTISCWGLTKGGSIFVLDSPFYSVCFFFLLVQGVLKLASHQTISCEGYVNYILNNLHYTTIDIVRYNLCRWRCHFVDYAEVT